MRDSDIDVLSSDGAQKPAKISDWNLRQTEASWLAQVTELAETEGWYWLHIDPAVNDRGYWRTPIRGPLGAGWPDLVLIHPERERVLFVELKSEKGKLKPQQEEVLALLQDVGQEVYVWRPSDWDSVLQCLTR